MDTFKVIAIHYGGKDRGNLGFFVRGAMNEFNEKYKDINEIKVNSFDEKSSIISEDYTDKNDLKKSFLLIKENAKKDCNKQDKLEFFIDDFVEKHKNNLFLVLNGIKYNFNKYLCVKDFLSIKNIKDIPIYNKNKDFWINEYCYSILYYPNSSSFTNIDSNHNENNIFLLEKERKIEDIAYSICYLKHYKFISLGMEKKIALYDLLFNFQMSYNSLDDKVSYIYELNDGKILLTDLNQKIQILKIEKNEIIIDSIIETKR